jgi:hypothetical protein
MYVLDTRYIDLSKSSDTRLYLVVELEVDTRVTRGWEESVTISKGGKKKFQWNSEAKSYQDAQAVCEKQRGGSFASVLSVAEQNAVEVLVPTESMPQTGSWLGGVVTTVGSNRVVKWADGSPPGYANSFMSDDRADPSFLYMNHVMQDGTKLWSAGDSQDKKPFVCQVQSMKEVGSTNKTLTFKLDTKGDTGLQLKFWWDYHFTSQDHLDNWEEPDRRMTGFRVNWYIRNEQGTKWEGGLKNDDWKNTNLVRGMTNWAMPKNEIEINKIISTFREEKTQSIDRRRSWYKTSCTKGQLLKVGSSAKIITLARSIDVTVAKSNVGSGAWLSTDVDDGHGTEQSPSDEDISTGLRLFFTLIYCSQEGIEMYTFFNQTISSESAPTILQTTMNMLRTPLKNAINSRSMNRLYGFLEDRFSLQLGKILVALSSMSELDILINRGAPYLAKFTDAIKNCKKDDNCTEVESSAKSLPGI